MLIEIDRDLWTCERPLKFLGVEVGCRMTVVRLSGGRLLLHSPVRPDEALRREVDALGQVRWVIAPNRFHHLFAGDWLAAYPSAEGYAAPGLAKKRPDVRFAGVLGDEPAGWGDEVSQVAWRGSPALNEVAFLHQPSRTLIVADLVHNVGDEKPLLSRVFYGLLGQAVLEFECRDRHAVDEQAEVERALSLVAAVTELSRD